MVHKTPIQIRDMKFESLTAAASHFSLSIARVAKMRDQGLLDRVGLGSGNSGVAEPIVIFHPRKLFGNRNRLFSQSAGRPQIDSVGDIHQAIFFVSSTSHSVFLCIEA